MDNSPAGETSIRRLDVPPPDPEDSVPPVQHLPAAVALEREQNTARLQALEAMNQQLLANNRQLEARIAQLEAAMARLVALVPK